MVITIITKHHGPRFHGDGWTYQPLYTRLGFVPCHIAHITCHIAHITCQGVAEFHQYTPIYVGSNLGLFQIDLCP